MSPFQRANIRVFEFVCVILVVYAIYEQFVEYQKNEDSSSVSFRKFNQDQRDIYPTYSICMHSTKGAILKVQPKDFENENHIGIDTYHKMLIGTEKLHKNFKNMDFENNVVDISREFIDMFVSFNKQGEEVTSWPRNKKSEKNDTAPFYESYRDPYTCCITKHVKFTKSQILHYDYLVLNSQKLQEFVKNVSNYDNTINLFLYIHHPGQLIREFGKHTFQLNWLDFENALNGKGNYHEIHMSHVEVVRKRHDGIIQCNETLLDEDDMFIGAAIKYSRCVPNFWKNIYLSSNTTESNLPESNSSIQYANIHRGCLPPNNFETIQKLYKEPCNQMRVTINLLQKSPTSLPRSSLVLALNYNTEEYRETLNHRAFGELIKHEWWYIFWLIIHLCGLTRL